MIKKLFFGAVALIMVNCSEMQTVANQLPNAMGVPLGMGDVSNQEISFGLKQALDFGIQAGVNSLGQKDGFFTNELVRIALPPELQKVDKTLRNIGLGELSDKGLKLLNSAASDAVTTAGPIFKTAVNEMSFGDAKNVLMGGKTAATQYLQNTTTSQLVNAFEPSIHQSLSKVGADRVWEEIITKYNTISLNKVNPNLTSYVTEQAVNGVFKMVAQKETDIRSNINARTTDALRKVFALQDKR